MSKCPPRRQDDEERLQQEVSALVFSLVSHYQACGLMLTAGGKLGELMLLVGQIRLESARLFWTSIGFAFRVIFGCRAPAAVRRVAVEALYPVPNKAVDSPCMKHGTFCASGLLSAAT